MLPIRAEGERISFLVRVTPRASADSVGGERDGALLVRVTAPPVENAANDATVALLAKALGLPRSAVRLERGAAARGKRISVPASAREVLDALASLAGPAARSSRAK